MYHALLTVSGEPEEEEGIDREEGQGTKGEEGWQQEGIFPPPPWPSQACCGTL